MINEVYYAVMFFPELENKSILINNNKREFSIKNLRHESIMNSIRVYEDLLEKINNGEFRNQKIKK